MSLVMFLRNGFKKQRETFKLVNKTASKTTVLLQLREETNCFIAQQSFIKHSIATWEPRSVAVSMFSCLSEDMTDSLLQFPFRADWKKKVNLDFQVDDA